MVRVFQPFLPILAAFILAAGCRSPQPALDRQETQLAQELATQWQAAQDLPAAALTWDEALIRLHAHNLELRADRDAVTTARERLRQVTKDLLPGVVLTGQVAKTLAQLGDLDGDDASLSLYAFFNVPGVIHWRVRHYAAELEFIRAGWAFELKQRELTIQLRELFLRSSLLEQRRKNLTLARQWQPADPLSAALESSPPGLEREATLWALRREDDTIQSAAAALLGDSGHHWRLLAATLPAIDYSARPPAIDDPAAFGRLHRRLQAADLEAARLRLRGVKLQYWPDLSINLSGPPIYQVAGGRNTSFSSDQIFVTLGTSLNLDLRGGIAQQLRETKRDFALLETRLREQNARLLQRLRQALDALALNTKQLRLTETRLDALRGLPVTHRPARARENLERLLALDQQRTALLLERAQLDALFWLLDETQWPPASSAPPSR